MPYPVAEKYGLIWVFLGDEQSKMFYIFFRNFFMEPEHDEMHVQRNLKKHFSG